MAKPCRRWNRAMARDRERRALAFWFEFVAWAAFAGALWLVSGWL